MRSECAPGAMSLPSTAVDTASVPIVTPQQDEHANRSPEKLSSLPSSSRARRKKWEKFSTAEIEDYPSKFAEACAVELKSNIKAVDKPPPDFLPDAPCPGWTKGDPNAIGRVGSSGAVWHLDLRMPDWKTVALLRDDLRKEESCRVVLPGAFSGLLVPAEGVSVRCAICQAIVDAKSVSNALRDPFAIKPWLLLCDDCSK